MSVEVVTPEDYVGDVIGDLSSRRGRIEGMDMRANARIIRAYVPLVGIFGYATDLRSKTSPTYLNFRASKSMPGVKKALVHSSLFRSRARMFSPTVDRASRRSSTWSRSRRTVLPVMRRLMKLESAPTFSGKYYFHTDRSWLDNF